MKHILLPLIVAVGLISGTPASASNEGITKNNKDIADKIARHTAAWFKYTTGHMDSPHLGQCGDYAVMFIQRYNKHVGKDAARLVTTNNPVPNGTYRLGEKIDISNLPFFNNIKSSGFYNWRGKWYICHPFLGAHEIFLEKQWTPKKHFGVNMLDKKQVHCWASIGDLSVDPTYFGTMHKQFHSPLGKDE
jgi:hypothetical protein